jgi:hypothetical protein
MDFEGKSLIIAILKGTSLTSAFLFTGIAAVGAYVSTKQIILELD